MHLDEKWFYFFKEGQRFYHFDGEKSPIRKVQSKRFITKVLFLAAVARPLWNTATNSHIDGKIGIWPFVKTVPAVRNSRNRAAETLVTQTLKVTKEASKKKLIDDVFPAIKENMASWDPRPHHLWPAGERTSAQKRTRRPRGSRVMPL